MKADVKTHYPPPVKTVVVEMSESEAVAVVEWLDKQLTDGHPPAVYAVYDVMLRALEEEAKDNEDVSF